MKKIFYFLMFFIFSSVLFCSCGKKEEKSDNLPVKDREINVLEDMREAYIFGFPIVMTHLSERVMTNPVDGSGNMPLNQFSNEKIFPDSKYSSNLYPNADTLYSSAWIELGKEPVILEIPDTKGRYSEFIVTDAWGNLITSLGKRISGTEKQKYIIAGTDWKGEDPAGLKRIAASSNMIWVYGYMRADSKADAKIVAALHKKLKIIPLEEYGGDGYVPQAKKVDETIDMADPSEQIFKLGISDYFNLLNNLIADNPPLAADAEVVKRIKYLNIYPGAEFDITVFDENKQNEINLIPEQLKLQFDSFGGQNEIVNGWTYSGAKQKSYGTDYVKRAYDAYSSRGLRLAEDYSEMKRGTDSDGLTLDGKNAYILHFEKDSLPPVNEFWSLAVYNDKALFAENTVKKYSIGSRDNLKLNKDGSLDIYLQKNNPGKAKNSNWLPVPAGNFMLVFRAYSPKEEMVSKEWKLSEIKNIKK